MISKIIEIIQKSNDELKQKILQATNQYEEILKNFGQKNIEEDEEQTLVLKIKESEKEILAFSSEIEHYKKQIEIYKNKLEFKINLEKAISLENLLKVETLKNKELKKEFESLNKVNNVQVKALNNYDKETRYAEKLEILKVEMKMVKESVKDFTDKYMKQDKFIKNIHERISMLENLTKKLLVVKIEIKKNFAKDDLKNAMEELNNIKIDVEQRRNNLKNIGKMNEYKINNIVSLNKQIEQDYKENEKVKILIIYYH
jgi:hypothetical protein